MKDYDCQVVDLFAKRKQVHLTERNIAEILDSIEGRTRQYNDIQSNRRGYTEWTITISCEESFSSNEATLPKGTCQVVDFAGKKAIIHNQKGKDIVNINSTNLNRTKEKSEIELRKHFAVVDQKLRQCVQPPKGSTLWARTAEAIKKLFINL